MKQKIDVKQQTWYYTTAAAAQSLQLCPSICDPWTVAHQAPLPMGILQARILEWVVISFSRGSSWPRDQTCVSCTAGRFFTAEPLGKSQFNTMFM